MKPETRNNKVILALLANKRITVDLNTGDVYSHRPNQEPLKLKPKLSTGYCMYCLNYKDKRYYLLGHRIVWLASGRVFKRGKTIDHINRIKTDNRLVNLRLATPKQQMKNSDRPKGSRSIHSKLTEELVKQFRLEYINGRSIEDIARSLNMNRSVIFKAIKGWTWRHVK
jgi:hypothetical protein